MTGQRVENTQGGPACQCGASDWLPAAMTQREQYSSVCLIKQPQTLVI